MTKTSDRVKLTGTVSEGGLLKTPGGETVKLRWGQTVNVLIGNVLLSGITVKDNLAGRWTMEIPLDMATAISLDAEKDQVTGSKDDKWALC